MLKHIDKILKMLAKQEGITMLGQFRREPAWRILISTILSASANDAATIPASKHLFKEYPSLEKLAKGNPAKIKKIIKKTVYFNNKTKYIQKTAKILLKKHNGKVPNTMEELMKLPGVGHKVAACVMVYAFNKAEIPVDSHVAVIANRLGWTDFTDAKKVWVDLKKKVPQKYWLVINELFVLHGQQVCLKRKPRCEVCRIRKYCRYYKEVYGA